MYKWTRPVGAVLLACMSVYTGHAIAADPVKAENPASKGKPLPADIKVVDDKTDPFDAAPIADTAVAPAPVKEATGQSMKASQMSLGDDGTINEFHVSDTNLLDVLRMLSEQTQKNIIPSKEVRGTVSANLYHVTLSDTLNAILIPNGFQYREKGNFIFVYTNKEIAELEKAERKTVTHVFHLYYTPAANAVAMIKPILSADAQVSFSTPAASGIATGVSDLGGNSHASEDMIIVTDYSDKIEQVKKVLKDIDRRPQQILVEATILSARITDDNALGVDFNVVGGVDFASITHASGQITNSNLPTGAGAFSQGVTQSSVGTGNTFSNSVANGFKVGVVTDNISVFLSALESVTDTVVLANPKILALNKQKGEVIVGRKDGYLTTTNTQTTTTQTVEYLETGTRLVFRPYIAGDGYVRMEIHPEDSSGGLTTSQNLPFKVTTEVTSNVMVKDGRTIVIGGLFREESDTTRSQVPGLGNLPVIGALFRQQKDHTKREEIIIMLTPHIINDESAYADASEEQIKKINDLRVGVRKGMMFYSRERMAESAYENALAELNKSAPNTNRALWHLKIATNLNPQFIEAIELKEKLTGKQITSVDNSIIRDFGRKLVAFERKAAPAPAEPVEPAVEPTTLPATQPVTEAAPETQPVAIVPAIEAVVPASQPAAAAPVEPAAEIQAAAPASQPAAETVSEIQPVIEAPATQPAGTVVSELPVADEPIIAAQPSTQPVTETPSAQPSIITELPTEPIAPETNK